MTVAADVIGELESMGVFGETSGSSVAAPQGRNEEVAPPAPIAVSDERAALVVEACDRAIGQFDALVEYLDGLKSMMQDLKKEFATVRHLWTESEDDHAEVSEAS